MSGRRTAVLVAAALLLLCQVSPAQEREMPSAANGGFPRPDLSARADTNDPAAYYNLGSTLMSRDPLSAGYAFHWASLLDPSMAEAYYARAISIELAWYAHVIEKLGGDRAYDPTPPADVYARYDTLMTEALIRNPFFDRRFDLLLWPRRLRERMANSNDPDVQGYYAYAMHEWPKATAAWAKMLKKHPEALSLHARRAQAFYFQQEFDSAYAELRIYVDSLEARQQKKVVVAYESKSILLYAMGMIRRRQQQYDAARREFGAALTENLAAYTAHAQLAQLDLIAGDTAGALGEYALAVEVKTVDPVVRTEYGGLLHLVHRDEEALRQCDAAIALDPFYAPPYALLGRVHDAHGRISNAVRGYEGYLRRAPRDAASRPEVEQRLATLRGGSAPPPGPGSLE